MTHGHTASHIRCVLSLPGRGEGSFLRMETLFSTFKPGKRALQLQKKKRKMNATTKFEFRRGRASMHTDPPAGNILRAKVGHSPPGCR